MVRNRTIKKTSKKQKKIKKIFIMIPIQSRKLLKENDALYQKEVLEGTVQMKNMRV